MPSLKKGRSSEISGARVLTSDKCAAILKEREEKKLKEKKKRKEGSL